jgi:hypothetical protein
VPGSPFSFLLSPLSLRRSTTLPIAIAIIVATPAIACAHHTHTGVTTTSTGDVAPAPLPLPVPVSVSARWNATITPSGDATVRGHADIAPTPGGKSATLILELAGLTPGKTYVWHIGHGACTDSETAGAPSDYLPLTADAQGQGSSSGSFPITNAGMTGYHIDVHPSGTAPAIACGILQTGSRP